MVFVNFGLLLAVVPLIADDAAGSGSAGAVSACFFLGAVATQAPAPFLLDSIGARLSLAVSLLLMALGSLAYAAAPQSIPGLTLATLVRGAGFGLATVAAGTMVAALALPERRGAVMGWAGLAAGIPPVFAPSLGIWIHDARSTTLFLIAACFTAAGACVVPLLARPELSPAGRIGVLLRALAEPRIRRPTVWFTLANVSRGGLITFVPILLATHGGLASASAYLLVFGTLAYLGRWLVGGVVDRIGSRAPTVAAAALSVAGLVLVAGWQTPLAALASAVCFGAGGGALMTTAQLDLLAQARGRSFSVPIAIWNIALDCGSAAGGIVVGLLTLVVGIGGAFWLLPAVMLLVLALVLVDGTRVRGELSAG